MKEIFVVRVCVKTLLSLYFVIWQFDSFPNITMTRQPVACYSSSMVNLNFLVSCLVWNLAVTGTSVIILVNNMMDSGIYTFKHFAHTKEMLVGCSVTIKKVSHGIPSSTPPSLQNFFYIFIYHRGLELYLDIKYFAILLNCTVNYSVELAL